MRTLPLFFVLLAACAPLRRAAVENVPPLVTRKEWGAKPPALPMIAHQPSRLTIHHTGVKSNRNLTLEEKLRGLQAFSQREDRLASGKTKPAWPDVPYHYYIDITGRTGEGRDVHYKGDTNTTYDPAGHVLVVLEGNFEVESPTSAQLASLRQMVEWLTSEWRIPSARIGAHRDFAQTDCPGDSLYVRMTEIRGWGQAEAARR